MKNDIAWHTPIKRNTIGQLTDNEVCITKSRLFLGKGFVEGRNIQRLMIGTSAVRRAIYFRADEEGYKLAGAKRGNYYVDMGTKVGKAVLALTRGEMVRKEFTANADGSFAVFL